MRRPVTDGATRVRLQAHTEHPIVACTSQTFSNLVEPSIAAGFEDFRAPNCFHKHLTFLAEWAHDEGCWPDSCDEMDELTDLCVC